jgi:LuxR family maltose regulon positive regulatory protein
VAQLHAALQQPAKVILISAPAGFGKTTLLSQWLTDFRGGVLEALPEIQNLKLAWLSLDENDNDPIRFWRYIIAAFQTVRADLGETALAMLQVEPSPPFETVLISLINDLAGQSTDVLLVLDDYHLIGNKSIHQTFASLIEHSSPQLRVCLSSRTQPPLPLARLRAKHDLIELRMQTIRFSQAEAATFLNGAMGLSLRPAEVDTLHAYTEGWIAGLKLAALSLQNQPEPERAGFVAEFTGQQPYIFDYLGEEVLHHQPPEITHFLVQTAILDRLSAGLCNSVSGREDGADILLALEKANLFVAALDHKRQWYRYHHLFRDFLLMRLQRDHPEWIPDLHRRAAAWYEQHDFINEAIEHHMAAQNVHKVAQLIEQRGDTMWTHHEMALLDRWISPLPEAVRRAHPKVMLFHAWALLIMRNLPAIESALQGIEPILVQPASMEWYGILLTIQGAVALAHRDVSTAIARYLEALRRLPESILNWRSAAQIGLGFAYRDQGDLSAAAQSLSTAISASMVIGNIYAAVYVSYYLGQLRIAQGRLQEALSTHHHAVELATQGRHTPLPIVAWPYLGLAEAYYEQNKLETAAQFGLQAIQWGKQTGDREIIAQSYLALARIKIALGQEKDATEFVHQAIHLAREANLPALVKVVQRVQASLWWIQGNIPALLGWFQELNLAAGDPPDLANLPEQFLQVRVLMALGNTVEACELLLKLRQAVPSGHRRTGFELQLLEALSCKAAGNSSEAMRLLEPVLAHGRREGYHRLFLDEGHPMATLLQEALSRNIEPGYAGSLLAEFTTAPADIPALGQALLEPLSQTELEILKLLATGWPNERIAQERTVSLNTIKWHLRNIYGKLGVRNRTAAASRAKALNLI